MPNIAEMLGNALLGNLTGGNADAPQTGVTAVDTAPTETAPANPPADAPAGAHHAQPADAPPNPETAPANPPAENPAPAETPTQAPPNVTLTQEQFTALLAQAAQPAQTPTQGVYTGNSTPPENAANNAAFDPANPTRLDDVERMSSAQLRALCSTPEGRKTLERLQIEAGA